MFIKSQNVIWGQFWVAEKLSKLDIYNTITHAHVFPTIESVSYLASEINDLIKKGQKKWNRCKSTQTDGLTWVCSSERWPLGSWRRWPPSPRPAPAAASCGRPSLAETPPLTPPAAASAASCENSPSPTVMLTDRYLYYWSNPFFKYDSVALYNSSHY